MQGGRLIWSGTKGSTRAIGSSHWACGQSMHGSSEPQRIYMCVCVCVLHNKLCDTHTRTQAHVINHAWAQKKQTRACVCVCVCVATHLKIGYVCCRCQSDYLICILHTVGRAQSTGNVSQA